MARHSRLVKRCIFSFSIVLSLSLGCGLREGWAGLEKGDSKLSSDIARIEIPSRPTTGTFKTLAILVNFQNDPANKPWTRDAIKTTLQEVSTFFYENSFRKTALAGDVAGWYTIPHKSTDACPSEGILASAKMHANIAGVNVSNYDRILVIFPKMIACAWSGVGTIGSGKEQGIAWVNGAPTLQVITHVMGHNFGLNDAHSLSCKNGAVIGIGNDCSSSQYGDPADAMGNSTVTHFNAVQKDSLGWLGRPGFPGITTVQKSGTYTIEPYETDSPGPKALRIPIKSPLASRQAYYYLEYRQPIGYDSVLGGNLTQGVLLHKGTTEAIGMKSYLLNMTPEDPSFWNAAITGSKVFTDPDALNGGVSIELVSVNSAGATVSVTFGSMMGPGRNY